VSGHPKELRLTPDRNGNERGRVERRPEGGFALVEVLVSAALLVAIAAGVAQVVALAVRAAHADRVRTVTTILGAQKMEQLRSLRLSDRWTDASTEPPTDAGPGLALSPPGTLDANVVFYADYLDGDGRWVGSGSPPPREAVYVRRWAVRPCAADPDNILILQVLVAAARGSGSTAGNHAYLVSIKAGP
jgi:type II secretory pathway pseudopilin PulG